MYRACILLADATRARIFVYERTTDAGDTHEQFTERTDLVDPARRLRTSELFSDSTSSRAGFDDHRTAHLEEYDAAFARQIVGEVAPLVRTPEIQRLVICASPKMLGELRALTADLARPGLVIEELARNFVKLTTPILREQLTAAGLLPPAPPRPALQATR